LYAIAVVELGLQPNYFWDEVTELELTALLDRLEKVKRERFENVRLLAYVITSVNGVKVDYDSFLNIGKEVEVKPLESNELNEMKDKFSKLLKR
jgi:hypothetical protein